MTKTKHHKKDHRCKHDHSCGQNDCEDKKYPATDYIVIGAGAAGSVVAGRLAEAGYTVRVLEAGPDTSPTSVDPETQLDILGIKYPMVYGYELSKRFYTNEQSCNCGFWQGTSSLLEFFTAPQAGGHQYAYPRGCGAGGCTSHHGTQDGIGPLEIYDNIANLVGDDYWLGSNVKTLFNKMENYQGPTTPAPCTASADVPSCSGGQASGHGYSGWLTVASPDKIDSLNQNIIDVAVNKFNVTCRPDFGTGAAGIGPTQYTIKADGTRSYAYVDLLMPVMQQTGRITVNFNTLVDKIVLEEKNCKDKTYNAKCVKAYEKPWLQVVQTGGSTFSTFGDNCVAHRASHDNPLPCPSYFYANKEIIICAGAIQSPTILMRSGIGPKDHLYKMNIKCKLDRPGVGSDILDHTEMALIFEFDPSKYINRFMASDYFAIGLINSVEDPVIMKNIQDKAEYECFNHGPGQIVMDWCSGVGGVDFPDTHAVFYPGLWFDFEQTYDSPYDPDDPHDGHPLKDLIPDRNNPIPYSAGLRMKKEVVQAQYDPKQVKSYMYWLIENLIPGTTPGTIRLRNKDPRSEPIIDEKLYLDDQGIERMARIAFLIRDIMNDPSIKDNGMPDYEFRPGPNVKTIEDMKEYIKNWYSFGHHISGGCQMSKPGVRNGVVSSHLKVFDVDGLRVADTSIYPSPWLHGYNTARGAYLIGEACADLILNH